MLILSKIISRSTLIRQKVIQNFPMRGRRINSCANLSFLKPRISSSHLASLGVLVSWTGSFKSYCSPISSFDLSKQMIAENGTLLLPAVNDEHGGITVDMKEPMEATIFRDALRASMAKWKHEGKKGVWIKLPIALANLVEIAVKEGFWYHHAEPKYLMLVYWIPETLCTIPANASHRVGVGALVLTETKEVLVVQENSGRFRGTGIWKIPTGVVDEGEDICVAAVREVKEETGIDTEFIEIVAFRQTHKSFYDKSDLFFLCFLRPLSFSIQKQELEIEAAQWMPLEEFAAQPFAQKSVLFKRIVELCLAKIDKNYAGFSAAPLSSEGESLYLYLNARDLNQPGPTASNQP